ncbi:hypothetical protein ES288_D04G124500v1 [Gossypium darwinii]|uniref:Uncharacterized protein n=1 Tax=Gossypium darwinii TaxID=34276 RepID=A0A5D2CVK6_GOSDA|nr:hypothetical protein ES288_D04G124500v1 [Gossypium darwinii]
MNDGSLPISSCIEPTNCSNLETHQLRASERVTERKRKEKVEKAKRKLCCKEKEKKRLRDRGSKLAEKVEARRKE